MSALQQFADTAVKSWKTTIERLDGYIAAADDSFFEKQIAPGRNRVRYLVGHLVAVHDRMLPLLGLGDRLHPELDAAYLENPDGTHPDPVSVGELKRFWTEVNGKLTQEFSALRPEQWLERHTAVSPDDFAKDPSRNRFAVLLSRTSHAAMHHGQLNLAKPRV